MVVIRNAQINVFEAHQRRATATQIVEWLTQRHPEVAGAAVTPALVGRAELALQRGLSLGFVTTGDVAGFVALCLAYGDDLTERDDVGPMLRDDGTSPEARLERAASCLESGGATWAS
jgi:hypothetical protein